MMASDAGRELLGTLEPLVGEWEVSGSDISGHVEYGWMEGGGFLVQKISFVHGGNEHAGVEYIGYDEESGTLKSHYFGGAGAILEYTYELHGDTLTIWFGSRGSEAKFEGKFSEDGNTNSGRWMWPGGGYESSMRRIGT